MGFVIIVALQIYALLSLIVIVLAVRYAKKRGKSGIKWGFGAAFIMYNLLFWDWIPTVIAHKYYCATQSGFWVYKTVDQWKAENPGVMERFPAPGPTGSPTKYESFDEGHGKRITFLLSGRINWIVTQQDICIFLPIIRTEEQVKDVKKGEVLARYVGFGTGHSVKNSGEDFPGELKFWMVGNNCAKDGKNRDALRNFSDHFQGRKK